MNDRITRTEFLAAGGLAGLQTGTGRSLADIGEAALLAAGKNAAAKAWEAERGEAKAQPAPSNWQKTRLVLPMPPSANRYWRTFRNVVVVSEEAKAYKAGVKASAAEQGATLLSGDVAVYIDVYRSRKAGDLDNRIKVALDALKGVAFEDDKQVVEIHARRFDDKNNGRIEITIETI
jgi:crossover junction endodeoxyribonuclease RusA